MMPASEIGFSGSLARYWVEQLPVRLLGPWFQRSSSIRHRLPWLQQLAPKLLLLERGPPLWQRVLR